jgi:hypothetical protein
VVVVEDDHEPIPAQSLLRASRFGALNRGRGHPAEDRGFAGNGGYFRAAV